MVCGAGAASVGTLLMGNPKDDLGWGGDHGGKLKALQTAIRILAGGGTVRDKFDNATSCLVRYVETDFPEALRPAFKRIIGARRRSRRDVSPTYRFFAFDQLGPSVRKQIVEDLTALHEACLIDLGRNWPEYDFMYPKGDVISKTKRPRRKKTIRKPMRRKP
jgi:hypothetical protein